MSELSHQRAPETKVETFSQGTEEAFSAASLAAFPTGTNPARLQRQPLNPNNVLALQRTIGNQAVQRLIKQKQADQTDQAVQCLTGSRTFQAAPANKIERLSTGGAVVQRFPSYSAFEKGWQKKTTRHKISVFGSTSAEYAHNAPGAKLTAADKLHKADILAAYQHYDSSRSMDALTELFHTITYWETLNQANSNQPWFKLAMEYLAELKDRIKAKVQAKVAKQHGPNITNLAKPFQQVPFSRSNQTSKIKNWGIEQKMPGFLKEVGVTPQYYAANLHPFPKRVQSLQKYYTALQDGNLSEAAKAYQDVSDVPNMYLVRPLFVAHFAQATKMDKLIGTDAQSNVGQELTQEEKTAILIYTGSQYDAMNNDLREVGQKAARQYPEFPVEADRSEDSMQKYKAGFKQKQADERRLSTMELVVSGLNKLPKYNGISYRGFKTAPKGYFDLVQPGAMLVDLAFQSASSSLEGARAYLAPTTGTKEIFCMIHTKTAVNIVQYSGIKKEAEILFRPGTGMKVKAIWQYVKGKIPRNAPPEAQMMLRSLGEKRSEAESPVTPGQLNQSLSGISPKELKERRANWKANGRDISDDQAKAIKWNPVKVIELVEV